MLENSPDQNIVGRLYISKEYFPFRKLIKYFKCSSTFQCIFLFQWRTRLIEVVCHSHSSQVPSHIRTQHDICLKPPRTLRHHSGFSHSDWAMLCKGFRHGAPARRTFQPSKPGGSCGHGPSCRRCECSHHSSSFPANGHCASSCTLLNERRAFGNVSVSSVHNIYQNTRLVQYHLSSCLRVASALNVVEILREAGPQVCVFHTDCATTSGFFQGLSANDIARQCNTDADKLGT